MKLATTEVCKRLLCKGIRRHYLGHDPLKHARDQGDSPIRFL